jgi:hypothetical protein
MMDTHCAFNADPVPARSTTRLDTPLQHKHVGAYHANRQTKEAVVLLEHVVKVKQITMAATYLSRQVSERA